MTPAQRMSKSSNGGVAALAPTEPEPGLTQYGVITTPKSSEPVVLIQANAVVYSSAFLALLQAMQYGLALSQLNLSTYNNPDDCNARPVVPDTCIVFPGHTKTEWTVVVNVWLVGAILSSLTCGWLSERFGRKRLFMANCVIMTLGAVLQATASALWQFIVGRLITGLATGVGTAMASSYINEIAPPHLRNSLGAGYQVMVASGVLVVDVSFFFANNENGSRALMAYPAVLALVTLLAAPRAMVESPTWLLSKGRHKEAEQELARMFGEANVEQALAWSDSTPPDSVESGESTSSSTPYKEDNSVNNEEAMNPWRAMFSTQYRKQTTLAVALGAIVQLSGINAVFMYSSSLFLDAGINDDRIGSLIVGFVNLAPSLTTGALTTRFGNRTTLLSGITAMLLSAVGLTVSLLTDVSVLSIVFVSTYVIAFSVSLGPLTFVVATAIFPDALRANGAALTLFVNWIGALIIGVGYPYVADALGDLGFLPYIATLSISLATLIVLLPETAGKTSAEIQRGFQGHP